MPKLNNVWVPTMLLKYFWNRIVSLSVMIRYLCKEILWPKYRELMKLHFFTISQRTIYSATSFLEKCRKVVWKSGLRNLVQEIWFEKSGWPEKNVVIYHKSKFFLVREKWLTRKKNPSLKNHFSRTTFLHFSRKVVVD